MWAGPGPLREPDALVDDHTLDWEMLHRLVKDERARYAGESEGRGGGAAVDVGEDDGCERRCKKQRNGEVGAASASDAG